jgi:hypothetical protein
LLHTWRTIHDRFHEHFADNENSLQAVKNSPTARTRSWRMLSYREVCLSEVFSRSLAAAESGGVTWFSSGSAK